MMYEQKQESNIKNKKKNKRKARATKKQKYNKSGLYSLNNVHRKAIRNTGRFQPFKVQEHLIEDPELQERPNQEFQTLTSTSNNICIKAEIQFQGTAWSYKKWPCLNSTGITGQEIILSKRKKVIFPS